MRSEEEIRGMLVIKEKEAEEWGSEFSLEYAEALEWVLSGTQWRSVEDELPEEDKQVLVYYHFHPESTHTKTGYYFGKRGWSIDDEYAYNVTHWMPLPTPPEGS